MLTYTRNYNPRSTLLPRNSGTIFCQICWKRCSSHWGAFHPPQRPGKFFGSLSLKEVGFHFGGNVNPNPPTNPFTKRPEVVVVQNDDISAPTDFEENAKAKIIDDEPRTSQKRKLSTQSEDEDDKPELTTISYENNENKEFHCARCQSDFESSTALADHWDICQWKLGRKERFFKSTIKIKEWIPENSVNKVSGRLVPYDSSSDSEDGSGQSDEVDAEESTNFEDDLAQSSQMGNEFVDVENVYEIIDIADSEEEEATETQSYEIISLHDSEDQTEAQRLALAIDMSLEQENFQVQNSQSTSMDEDPLNLDGMEGSTHSSNSSVQFVELIIPNPIVSCIMCHREYISDEGLDTHVLKYHKEEEWPFKCPYCSKRFHATKLMFDHTRKCGLENGRTMPKLTPAIPSVSTPPKILEDLSEYRNNSGCYKCPSCSKIIVLKHNFKDHMNSHWGVRPHKCTFCPEMFSARKRMSEHRATCKQNPKNRTKENSASESSGPSAVASTSKTHGQTYPKKAPGFPCPFPPCKIRRVSRPLIEDHVNAIHTKATPYACPGCFKKFHTKAACNSHCVKSDLVDCIFRL